MISSSTGHKSGEHELIHLSLEALFPGETGTWLVIDLSQSLVTRLQANQNAAHICCHQQFSPNALRLLIPLLLFPECCPHSYLLAALQVPEQKLIHLLTLAHADPLVLDFFHEVERSNALLEEARPGKGREQHLRYLRRVMTETLAGCSRLGLTIISLRRVGYRLQPTIFPSRSRSEHRAVPFVGVATPSAEELSANFVRLSFKNGAINADR
jgi:hypothetical protein